MKKEFKFNSNQIFYRYKGNIYLNITNKCNCDCIFCIKKYSDSLSGNNLIFNDLEPQTSDIIEIIKTEYIDTSSEIIFCGFGEPFCRFKELLELTSFLKKEYPGTKIRINTNGLGNLINNKDTLKVISENIDAISISLNAHNSEIYNLYTKPKHHKEVAFETVINTIKTSVELGLKTSATVVYGKNLDKIDLNECEKICNNLGAEFKIRHYE